MEQYTTGGGSRREYDFGRQRSSSMSAAAACDSDWRFEGYSTKSGTASSALMAAAASSSSSSSSSSPSASSSILDYGREVPLRKSPTSRRKLTICHLDQPPLPLQPTLEQVPEARKSTMRSPDPLQERLGLRSRVSERHPPPKALSPLGSEGTSRGDMKPWAEVAIKPFTETMGMPPSSSWRGRYSPEGSIFKSIPEYDKGAAQKKAQEAKKSSLELPFTSSPYRSSLSPSSSVSSTSPSLPRELGKEDPLTKSPLLSSPTLSTSSGESRSSSQMTMALFGKESRENPFSLEMFKMNRSESSLPLLSPDESQPNHGTFKEPVKPTVLKEPKRTQRLKHDADEPKKDTKHRSSHASCKTSAKEGDKLSSKDDSSSKQRKSHTSSLKVRIDETKQKETTTTGKKMCRLCARENDKRQKKKKQEQLAHELREQQQQLSGGGFSGGGAASKRRSASNQGKGSDGGWRRGELRSQGSLDSAREKESQASKSTPPLIRSGSLDLEKAERNQREGGLSRDASLSNSQDSLQSDMGGAPTLHRYYHVFREGELDQLIEKYVQNLHIISSYYDHANWCIVAEKVQVWTI